MGWSVYMLLCGDGSLYTGSTNDVARRLAAHRRGKGAKYTRSRLPVSLAYREEVPDRSAALRREAEIKRMDRAGKLALIEKKEERAMEMRREDRRLTEAETWDVVDTCAYAFLAMTAEDGGPYGVAVNIVREGRSVYFHSALEGRKTDCLRRSPRVCLTCVGEARVAQQRFTTLYRSAVASGTAREVTEEDGKRHALELLCRRHAPEAMGAMDGTFRSCLPRTAVWEIAVEEISGKANR